MKILESNFSYNNIIKDVNTIEKSTEILNIEEADNSKDIFSNKKDISHLSLLKHIESKNNAILERNNTKPKKEGFESERL